MFDPGAIQAFRFTSCDFDEISKTARFCYAFDGDIEFVEQLVFSGASGFLSEEHRDALNHCLKYLHLVLGISYFKAAVPSNLIIEHFTLSEKEADFFNRLYYKGLGEFAYKNSLD